MKVNKRILLLLVICAFVMAAAFAYWGSGATQDLAADYSQAALRDAHSAADEVAEAKRKLPDAAPASVIANDLSGKKQVALTFDGMTDHDTMRQILEILAKHQVRAAFFVEGANAAAAPDVIAAIGKGGHTIGNYTYVGIAHADRLSPDQLLTELCRAQKALLATSGAAPSLFKCAQTVYTEALLKAAAACGLDSAVKTSVFAEKDELGTPAQARAFVLALKPGSIISLRLGKSVEVKQKAVVKEEEKPALDKKPIAQQESVSAPASMPANITDSAAALEQLLLALKEQKYDIALVDHFRKFQYTPAAKQAALFDKWANTLLSLRTRAAALLSPSKAYAAAIPATQAPQYDYAALRQHNGGKLADEVKMVMTTEQAVPYTFAGLTNESAVRGVLREMDRLGVKATFFIMEQELKKYPQLVGEIVSAGHEIGVALRPPKENASFDAVCAEILRTRDMLRERFGVTTDLLKQPWGVIADQTKEAAAAAQMRLIGQTVNVVQAKHKDFSTAEAVMQQIFGKAMHSVGRGWIVHFRMDYYTKPQLVVEVATLLKKQKIDNIAYRSYDDDPERNPKNDSGYHIRPVGAVLDNSSFAYQYPVPPDAVPEHLRSDRNFVGREGAPFRNVFEKRYIGANDVKDGYRMLGFSNDEVRRMDVTGLIHTEKPAVFFGIDDWGTDVAVNQLLYVLRKHKARATFFILTNNVLANPNLLRAIAAEGHDIACHTNSHLPMVVRDANGRQSLPQTREQWTAELALAYQKLESVVGDVRVDGSYALTRLFRPPTLAISKDGAEALFSNGYEYIVSGSTSTEDYSAAGLQQMIERIKGGLYANGTVKKGAVFVMHTTDSAKFTAKALDAILTANEEKVDGDPTKFVVGKLSDYLTEGYDQSNRKHTLALEQSHNGKAGEESGE